MRCYELTSVDIFIHRLSNRTLLRNRNVLGLLIAADGAEASIGIHGSLESIALPAKDVVRVLSVSGVVSRAQHKGLGAIRGPLRLVVE